MAKPLAKRVTVLTPKRPAIAHEVSNMNWKLTMRRVLPTVALMVATWTTSGAVAADAPETIENSIGMKLVLIPAGEFMMGAEEDREETLDKFSPHCELRRLEGEFPQHRVKITKPFFMGKYEVTLGQFRTFYDAVNYKIEIQQTSPELPGFKIAPWAPGWEIGEDHPVVYVTWDDAVAFCKWLSTKESKTYRLPTEAEWEYACRAGGETRYHFGNEPEDLVGFANSADADRKAIFGNGATVVPFDKQGKPLGELIPFPYLSGRDGHAWTAPVGKYHPNDFGLYDMHGNACEWCADWYDKDYFEHSPLDDPQGPATGTVRVVRGGSFHDMPEVLRCAYRIRVLPAWRYRMGIGFRVVCEP
jgi:formylglycine-generating enzyme